MYEAIIKVLLGSGIVSEPQLIKELSYTLRELPDVSFVRRVRIALCVLESAKLIHYTRGCHVSISADAEFIFRIDARRDI